MKKGFYFSLASSNLRKNYRFYIPRILTEAGLLSAFYIVLTLANDKRLAEVEGGSYIPTFMSIGLIIMVILTTVLTLYTNSFLMKQRKREFGMYNVLGMEKRHVGRVLLHESLLTTGSSVLIGIVCGILFYKLCTILICRLLQAEILAGVFYVNPYTTIASMVYFAALDLMVYVYNRISIARMKPTELLASKAAGEKEPRTQWILFLLGVLALGSGYYRAVSAQNALTAVNTFLPAVVLVIIGTYFLFIAGSIFILKCLKRNEKFYYSRKHMTAVSGLIYRMKQNAAGLASIAILATCVLVMISSTVTLYSGMQDTIRDNYPDDMYITAAYEDADGYRAEMDPELVKQMIVNAAEENGIAVKNAVEQKFLYVAFLYENDQMYTRKDVGTGYDTGNLAEFYILSTEVYESMTGNTVDLEENQILMCTYNIQDLDRIGDTVTMLGDTYEVAGVMDTFPLTTANNAVVCSFCMVVSSDEVLNRIYEKQTLAYELNSSDITSRIAVSFESRDAFLACGTQVQESMYDQMNAYVHTEISEDAVVSSFLDSVYDARIEIYGMYGSLLFLGMILGVVFMFSTVLIIYYKQISEGYEDRTRFQIMQKIGMSSDEVRRTINHQIVLVFFLPLMVAGVHMIFAFPLLEKLLKIMLLSSSWLFVKVCLIVYAVFAVVYTVIYMGTARTYYKIVH